MLFKNNPGKEENMHRGSETKFPWWYFLHTGGDSGWPMRSCLQERTTATVHTKTSPSPTVSFSLTSNPSFSHYHSLSSPLKHLPTFYRLVPLIQSLPLSDSAVSLCVQSCVHSTNILKWAHSHWPYTVPHFVVLVKSNLLLLHGDTSDCWWLLVVSEKNNNA